jgi:DNA-binding NarL/FixJ family response regulator
MIRVLIADDHQLMRQCLRSLLAQHEGEIEVVGEAASGREVLLRLERAAADVVLMDMLMPEGNGIETTQLVVNRFPTVKVLMLSMIEDEQWVIESLQVGAKGYLLKTAGHQELLHAIRIASENEEYFCTDLTKLLLRKLQASSPAHSAPSAPSQSIAVEQSKTRLSPQELKVLRLIAQGYTNTQISGMLSTSRRTVEAHRQNILEKTGTNNTASLMMYAVAHQLLK